MRQEGPVYGAILWYFVPGTHLALGPLEHPMATIQPLRVETLPSDQVPPDGLTAGAALHPWLAGRPSGEHLVDLLAFAMATERGLAATDDVMPLLRDQAHAALATYSIRNVHNRVAEIRQEAISEHMARFARPPGFLKIAMANLLALLLAGGVAVALYLHPEPLAALVGLISG